MKVLIFFLLFSLTLGSIQLYQNSSISIFGSDNFYLNLDGYKSGDIVYIDVSYISSYYYNHSIRYRLSNSCYESEFSYLFTYLASYNNSSNNNKTTKYYAIKLNGNYNYLLIRFSGDFAWFTIKNKKFENYDSKISNKTNSNNDEIKHEVSKISNYSYIILALIIIGFIIIIIILSVIICCLCKRRSLPDYASRIDSPLVPSYPVVEPLPQPIIYTQPGY